MKTSNSNLKSIFAILFSCLFIVAVNAQSADDLYYTPNTVNFTVEDNIVDETLAANDAVSDDTQFYTNDNSDYNQAYEDDYYYQSRLRRFSNPFNGLGYYAPVYTNPYYYNNSPFAWSNNIYYQPVYGQNWWTNNRSYNNFYNWNNGFNNFNYTSNFAPYTSFGSTVFNSPYSIGSRGYNYNTGGIFQSNPYNNPCVVNNFVRNSVDSYNNRTSNGTKASVSSRSERERPSSYTPSNNNVDRNKRTSGVRTPSGTKNNYSNRPSSTQNKSNVSPKPRPRSSGNSTRTKSKSRVSNFFGSLQQKDNDSNKSYRDNSSRSNSGKSYRSGSSNTRSYGSSSRSSSRSSGSRSSRSGGRR